MEEFEKIMNREGMKDLMRPMKYIAQIPFPDMEHPTVLGSFKTKEARLKWYQEQGSAFEYAAERKIEFSEAPMEDGEKFTEDQGK